MSIEELLTAHTVEDYSEGEFDGDASLLCACRFVARGSDLYDAGDEHRAHVAAALAAAGIGDMAAAWDEGYDRAKGDHCDYYPSQDHCDMTSHNPHRTDATA